MNNEDNNSTQEPVEDAIPKDDLRSLQLVRAGSIQFGVFADEIATIAPWREPTPLPQASGSVLGVVSIQGRMLTVLELATLAGAKALPSDMSSDSARQIVALRGDEQLALAVDSVGDTVGIAVSDLQPHPEKAAAPILGSLQLDNSEINVLNLRDLFSTAIHGRERRRRRF